MPKTVSASSARSRATTFYSFGAVWVIIGLFIGLDRGMWRTFYAGLGPLLQFVFVILLGPLNVIWSFVVPLLTTIPTR